MSQSEIPVDIEAYLHTHEQLLDAIRGLNDEQLKWKAAPDKWSITEVLAHLADHNIVVSFRIREILSGSDVRLPAFRQDPWVEGQKANEGTAAEFLASFHALLVFNSLLFRRLGKENWKKTGVNFKDETVNLPIIIRAFIAHVQTHLSQIARIKQGSGESLGSSCSI
ncbi:DinB family protein [Cohnella faecalis]|uniref:DinB family protein n=1 Tax=Cohnella faecalis TaxID=2315694 RepID=A0A398CTB5_9BACL|nr:DinB family protein [Cohnella faecalis]RIE04008.1 DinB family protein [Cohnella faecalis]